MTPLTSLDWLIIHCTDTPEVPQWNIDRLNVFFRDMFNVRRENRGYHVVIAKDGTITRRIPHKMRSSYAISQYPNPRKEKPIIGNGNSEHLSYFGGWKGKDDRTEAQKKNLEAVVKRYWTNYPNIKIGGHNQFAAKACPSFDVPSWLESIGCPEQNIYRGKFNHKLA